MLRATNVRGGPRIASHSLVYRLLKDRALYRVRAGLVNVTLSVVVIIVSVVSYTRWTLDIYAGAYYLARHIRKILMPLLVYRQSSLLFLAWRFPYIRLRLRRQANWIVSHFI